MSSGTMVTKKIRTEYMKRFRDPKWETFSKCYEDSLKYRLTRRVMEHSHKPWFWEGWDSGSDSSGWSTPRLSGNKIAPLSLPPPTSSETNPRRSGPGPELRPEDEEAEELEAVDGGQAAVVENGVEEASGAAATALPDNLQPPDDAERDNGPAETGSSDGEPGNPAAGPRHGRRTPPSQLGQQDGSVRKAPRAKSQPAISSKEARRSARQDQPERHAESASDACVPTHRGSSRRSSNLDRRRARSADLEKAVKRSQLTPVDERWMTEYMRCFSARLR